MEIAKSKKRLKTYSHLKEIVEISKFDTLNKLNKKQQIKKSLFEMAYKSKNVIEVAHKKYHIKNNYDISKTEHGNLWVFISFPPAILDASYEKFEKMIKESFNPEKDKLIVVGLPAIKFSKKTNYKTIYSNENYDESLLMLPSIISQYYLSNHYGKVNVVLNSERVEKEPVVILPISQSNFKFENQTKPIDSSYTFFPSIHDAVENLTVVYTMRIIQGLMEEANIFVLKEKLLKIDSTVKKIDEKTESTKREIRKQERYKETEDMIFSSIIQRKGGEE